MQNPLLLWKPQQYNEKNQMILRRGSASSIHRCECRGPPCILLLITKGRRITSQQRSSRSWICRQHHTCNHTTSYGFTRDEIFMSANNVSYHTTSSPSRMRYCVMFPHWKSMMFCYANHICGGIMLFMSLDPITSLLLWGVIPIGYQR